MKRMNDKSWGWPQKIGFLVLCLALGVLANIAIGAATGRADGAPSSEQGTARQEAGSVR